MVNQSLALKEDLVKALVVNNTFGTLSALQNLTFNVFTPRKARGPSGNLDRAGGPSLLPGMKMKISLTPEREPDLHEKGVETLRHRRPMGKRRWFSAPPTHNK